jgi:hypothetical protein
MGYPVVTSGRPTPLHMVTVEYVYSKGNTGGVSLNFSPSKQRSDPAGFLERDCPVAAAAQSVVHERIRVSGGLVRVTDVGRATATMMFPKLSTKARTYIYRLERPEYYTKRRVAASREESLCNGHIDVNSAVWMATGSRAQN